MIQIRKGGFFNFEAPDHSRYDIEEIAHALSNICRFTGHCRAFYSVAQHSVLVSHLVRPANALAGLLHDAHEAFVGDMSSPLKRLIPQYREIEERVQTAVRARFGLPAELPADVHLADLTALSTEKRDLMHESFDDEWAFIRTIPPRAEVIEPLPPGWAYRLFMNRYEELIRDYPNVS